MFLVCLCFWCVFVYYFFINTFKGQIEVFISIHISCWVLYVLQETRFRQRYLDLIINESSRNKFVVRAKIVNYLRRFMDQMGFLEVKYNTPHSPSPARLFYTCPIALMSGFGYIPPSPSPARLFYTCPIALMSGFGYIPLPNTTILYLSNSPDEWFWMEAGWTFWNL